MRLMQNCWQIAARHSSRLNHSISTPLLTHLSILDLAPSALVAAAGGLQPPTEFDLLSLKFVFPSKIEIWPRLINVASSLQQLERI